jgi:hypothetical protein
LLKTFHHYFLLLGELNSSIFGVFLVGTNGIEILFLLVAKLTTDLTDLESERLTDVLDY